MKIIFLDFDGPLSNFLVTLGYGDDDYMDPTTILALNNICEASGAKIVCTSTRAILNDQRYKDCMWRFQQAGLDISHIHPDWSCNTDNGGNRYEQIESWIADHPEVTHYAVIDDERVFDRRGGNHPKLVKTSMYDGMGMDQFRRLAILLDFDLLNAFHAARTGHWQKGQLTLPFDHSDTSFNARLVVPKLSENEKASGLWYEFHAQVYRQVLEDGRINAEFSLRGSVPLKGNLYVAPKNIRQGEDHDVIFLRHGTHSLIIPKVS